MTTYRFANVEAYLKALFREPQKYRGFNVSPGWAVAHLGVSRQRVYRMMDDGVLDTLKTEAEVITLLRRAEVMAYHRMMCVIPRAQRSEFGRAWKRNKETGHSSKNRMSVMTADNIDLTMPAA